MATKTLKRMEVTHGFIHIPADKKAELLGNQVPPFQTKLNDEDARVDTYGRIWSDCLKNKFVMNTKISIDKDRDGFHVTASNLNDAPVLESEPEKQTLSRKTEVCGPFPVEQEILGTLENSSLTVLRTGQIANTLEKTVSVESKPTSSDNEKADVDVICGDVIEEMKKLVLKGEKFDCIFADPDYNVGIRYSGEGCKTEFTKYIQWCVEWSKLAHALLDDKGNFFIINYPENTAYLKVRYLDEAFYDVQEYVWVYNVNIGHSAKRFTRAHRTILHCTKSKDNSFYKDNVAVPYQNPEDKRIQQNLKNGSKGRMPYSWLYFDLVKNVSKDKTFHPCQIPRGLSKLLIGSCTMPKNKVLVLFTGSGNDVLSALELGTKVTTIDKNEDYCELMRERAKTMNVPLTHYTERS